MPKLVQYVGDADVRIVSAEDFAKAGISSPTLRFSHFEEMDYFASVSDVVAVYLLAQGDFRAYNGETLLDILQHISSPDAVGEVTSVSLGESGTPQTGAVVVPVDGPNNTPSLRTLGTQPGQAMPGNDTVRTQAIRTTIFGSSNRGNRVIISDSSGATATVQLGNNEILIGGESGIVSMSLAEFITLVETGDASITMSTISDLDAASSQPNYVLTDLGVGNSPRYGFRPPPLVGNPPGTGTGAPRFGSFEVEGVDSFFDLTLAPTASTYVVRGEETDFIELRLPTPVTSEPFFVYILAGGPISEKTLMWSLEDESSDSISIPDSVGEFPILPFFVFPIAFDEMVQWVFYPVVGPLAAEEPEEGAPIKSALLDLTGETPGELFADLYDLDPEVVSVAILAPTGGASIIEVFPPSYQGEASFGFDVTVTASDGSDVSIKWGLDVWPHLMPGVAHVRFVPGGPLTTWIAVGVPAAPPAPSLASLPDVDLGGIEEGQTMAWNDSEGKMVPASLPALDLDGITEGQTVVWDESEESLVPADFPTGGGGSGTFGYVVEKRLDMGVSPGTTNDVLKHRINFAHASLQSVSVFTNSTLTDDVTFQMRVHRATNPFDGWDDVGDPFTIEVGSSEIVVSPSFVELREGDLIALFHDDNSPSVNAFPTFTTYTLLAHLGSSSSPEWTEPSPPDAPLLVQAMGGQDEAATISWSFPEPNGAIITGYIITPYIDGVSQTPVPISVPEFLEHTLTGLTNLTDYTFTVRAVNAAGTGPESEQSNEVRPHEPGDPFAYGTGVARGGGVLLSSDSFNRTDGNLVGSSTDGSGSEDPLTWQDIPIASASILTIDGNSITNDVEGQSMAMVGPFSTGEIEVSLKITTTALESTPGLMLFQMDGTVVRVIQFTQESFDPIINVMEMDDGNPVFQSGRTGSGQFGVSGNTIVLQVVDGVVYGFIDDTVSGLGQSVSWPLPDGWTGPWNVAVVLGYTDTGDDFSVRDIS